MKFNIYEKAHYIKWVLVAIFILTLIVLGNKMVFRYEKEQKDLIKGYEQKIIELTEDNDKLSKENQELSNNIYNVFEKQPYTITIKHDDEYITYSQDKFGLFDSYTKSIGRTLGIRVEEP